ncbi:MAG TPA: flagellar assembly protein FliH [Bacillales bacterium]|nr:flagellar assembly protein FliH [Bacillales bacterium]
MIKSGNANKGYSHRKTIQLSNMIFDQKDGYYTDSETVADPVPILKKAEIEAKEIRRLAKEEAEQIYKEMELQREQAKQEIDRALQDATEKGWQQGYQVGMREGKEKYEELIAEAKNSVEATKKARKERLDETEHDILELGVKIADKIIGSVLLEDTERWLEMVKKAISEVKEYGEIRLIVHHKWYDFMLSHKKEFESLLKNSAEFYIYPEITDDEFTCLIEFPSGRIDASVDSQLTEIKKQLAAKLEEAQDERYGSR